MYLIEPPTYAYCIGMSVLVGLVWVVSGCVHVGSMRNVMIMVMSGPSAYKTGQKIVNPNPTNL